MMNTNRKNIMSNTETSINNTYLTEEELEHFKNKLLKEQEEAESKIEELEDSISDLEGNLDDNTSSSAHHQGDLGSEEELRETKYTLIEKQKDKLEQIKVALDRIETGNYGICIVTGNKIQKERLEAVPYAMHSIEAKKGEIDADQKEMNVQSSSN